MRDPLEFAILGLSVVGSISVAVVVEWIGLWGLMKMMPAPEPALESATGTAEASPRAASQVTAAASEIAAAASEPAPAPQTQLQPELQPMSRRSTRQPVRPLASAATVH
jgi:hypothetical protein